MDRNRYFFIGSVFNFSVTKQMIAYRQISCICLYANKGRKSKTKDSVCNTHLNFRSFFSGKKVRIIQG